MADQLGSSKQKIEAKELKDVLKDVLKIQGDYRDMLKESLQDLQKSITSYDKLSARIATINRDTINTKQVQDDMVENATKQYVNSKKIEDLEKKLGGAQSKKAQDARNFNKLVEAQQKAEAVALKASVSGYKNLEALALKKLQAAEDELDKAKKSITTEQAAYAQALKSKELYAETAKQQAEQLEFEEKLSKQVGFTGAAFKFLADKIGVGESYQKMMVLNARNLNEETKKFGFVDKLRTLKDAGVGAFKEIFKDPLAFAAAWKVVSAGFDKLGGAAANVGKGIAGLSDESSTIVSGIAGHVSGLLKNIPLVGGLLGGLVEGFASIFDLVVGVENTVVKSGRELGMSRHEAEKMHHEFAAINVTNGDIFVTSRKLLETQVELSKTLGVNAKFTEEQLATSIKLKDLAGLENETIAQFAEISKISGKSQEGVVKSVLAQVEGLKKATGISLNQKQILKETAGMSGVLGLQFAKYPEKLTKSLLTVKALGLELKDVDALADSFLDFESSISNEMEAQLLTGKNINLSKARELFLTNDLAGAAMEINSQVGSSAEFLKLNRIQAESLAKAFGMSRDQMGDMLKKQEFLGKLGAKETDNAREQLRLGLEKYKSQKALSEALGQDAYNSLVTASTQEKMAALIEKIKNSMVDFLSGSGIMEKIQHFMDYLSEPKNVRAIINSVKGFMADAVEFIGNAAYRIIDALDYIAFGQIPNDFIESIKSGAANMGASIRSIGIGGGEMVGANAAASTVAATTPAKTQGFANPNQKMVTENGKNYLIVVDRVTGKVIKKELINNESVDVATMY